MKIIERVKNLERLCLPETAGSSDTTCALIYVHETIKSLQLSNLNIDFAGAFIKPMPKLKALEFINASNRIKEFDENELKFIAKQCPTIKNLSILNGPITDKSLAQLLPAFPKLKHLCLLQSPNLTNHVLEIVSKNCCFLTKLEIGGKPTQYNTHINLNGLENFNKAAFELIYIKIEFISQIGDQSIGYLCYRFQESLQELHIYRNCFEKCAKISDKVFSFFKYCDNLEKLTIQYTRKFRENFHINLGENLSNIRYLNFRDCPIQEDLQILSIKCPNLEEINLSGDSWLSLLYINYKKQRVRRSALLGLSKHKNIRILHIGHFEHSDQDCDKNIQESPPKGMFIESLFQKAELFQKLQILYLEQECSLTYWLDVRIRKLRSSLTIKYTPAHNILSKI